MEPVDLPTSQYVTHRFGEAQLSDPEKSFEPCCKDMTTAMSFPAGRHFFLENGVLMLTVAKAILKDGSEGILEHPVRFCPFCGKPVQVRSERPLRKTALKAPDPEASSNIDLGSTTNLSAMPDSRHKSRNAGQILAANHETKIFAAKYP